VEWKYLEISLYDTPYFRLSLSTVDLFLSRGVGFKSPSSVFVLKVTGLIMHEHDLINVYFCLMRMPVQYRKEISYDEVSSLNTLTVVL
jgi:hypothetical protein